MGRQTINTHNAPAPGGSYSSKGGSNRGAKVSRGK